MQNGIDAGRRFSPGRHEFCQILAAIVGQDVVFSAGTAMPGPVFGQDQPLAFQAQQQGIEGTFGQIGKSAFPQGGEAMA